jgi:hypothetical protein
MKRILATFAVGTFLLALGACGERPQILDYKQGTYQGKHDTPPYQGPAFSGNKSQWENAIKTRQQNQNEYRRTN